MRRNAPREQPGGSPPLLRPCRRETPARAPRGELGATPPPRWVSSRFPKRKRAPRVSHPSPVGPGGGKVESTGQRRAARRQNPRHPAVPSRGPEQPRQGTQPPSGRAAAAAAVPRRPLTPEPLGGRVGPRRSCCRRGTGWPSPF